MGGCNCKNGQSMEDLIGKTSEKGKVDTVVKYVLKTIGFLLLLLLLPLINLAIIWFMFNMLVLNKNVDIKPLLLFIGEKFKKEEKDEEFLGYDLIDDDEYIMMDVEDITNK